MSGFLELTILFTLAAVLSLIANKLKQPLILGYILAGVIVQASGIVDIHNGETFELFSEIGIVFLLFILGLDLDTDEMKHLGIPSLVTGLGQIIFTVVGGLGIALAFGYSLYASLILAIALTFSSTIVIVKLLSRNNELNTVYGKVATGFLLVQDAVAIVILILLAASLDSSASDNAGFQIVKLLISIPLVGIGLYLVNKYFIPRLIAFTGHDREVLFISIIALALFLSSLISSEFVGLSLEVGALAAGISLSNRKEALQIESWTTPLRDFFIPIFFVLLGFQIELGNVAEVMLPAFVFSIFVLLGNPLIVMILMRMLKFDSATSFKAGLTVAQISEFSLLVASMALLAGVITSTDLTLLTIVGGITMTGSSYMILYSEKLYNKMVPLLRLLRLHTDSAYETPNYKRKSTNNKIIVFGFNRMTKGLEEVIKKGDSKFLVIDSNPERLEFAEKLGATTAFGDLKDQTLLHELKLAEAQLIISTVPDQVANFALLSYIETEKIDVPVVVNAAYDHDAKSLYDAGATFVLHPYLLVTSFLNRIIQNKDTISSLKRAAKSDLEYLD